MPRRESQKTTRAARDARALVEALEDVEAKELLGRLLDAHPDLLEETARAAEEKLGAVTQEAVAHDVAFALEGLSVEDVWERSGRDAHGRYVEPIEAAWDVVEEAIAPFLTDPHSTRRARAQDGGRGDLPGRTARALPDLRGRRRVPRRPRTGHARGDRRAGIGGVEEGAEGQSQAGRVGPRASGDAELRVGGTSRMALLPEPGAGSGSRPKRRATQGAVARSFRSPPNDGSIRTWHPEALRGASTLRGAVMNAIDLPAKP